MNNFRIQLDANKNLITISYYDTAQYRTLLKSLSDLLTVYMPKGVSIVLDFCEVKSFQISYGQIANFRDGLLTLFPKNRISRIAIINATEPSWGGMFCASPSVAKNKSWGIDLRCFGAHQKTEAYNWI
jgi:hypothetical protein